MSLSLLRGLFKQPEEGRGTLKDDEYLVVVNRLVKEEVERVLEIYLTLTSSYYEDWTKQQKTARPGPTEFLQLVMAGQVKGLAAPEDVYDKKVKLATTFGKLVAVFRGADSDKKLEGFLDWLQGQVGDPANGEDAKYLVQNLELMAKLIDRLGKIGLTKKELDVSKEFVVVGIVGDHPELILRLAGPLPEKPVVKPAQADPAALDALPPLNDPPLNTTPPALDGAPATTPPATPPAAAPAPAPAPTPAPTPAPAAPPATPPI